MIARVCLGLAVAAFGGLAVHAQTAGVPNPVPRPPHLGTSAATPSPAPSFSAPQAPLQPSFQAQPQPAVQAPAPVQPAQALPEPVPVTAAPAVPETPAPAPAGTVAAGEEIAPDTAPLDLSQPPPAPLMPAAITDGGGNPVDTAEEQHTLAKVNTYFNGIRTLVGDFTQVGPDGSRADGKFFLAKPGKVRFYYQRPATTDIIADGKSLVVRDRRLATQDVYPLSQTPLKFLLDANLDLARDSKVIGVFEEPGLVSVAIEEETTFGGKARVLLVFGTEDEVNYELRQWTITDPQGLNTTIAVFNLDSDTRPNDKLFAVDYSRDISRN